MFWLDDINRRVGAFSRRAVLLLSFAFIVAVGITDYRDSVLLQPSVFYILPIMAVTWYVNRTWGVVFALLAMGIAGLADLHTDVRLYAGYGGAFLWQSAAHLLLYLLIVAGLDTTALRFNELRQKAEKDLLTGVLNKLTFHHYLRHHLRLARHENWLITVAYVDLDKFKLINDTCGHSEGDRILREVASIMRETLRQTDAIGRLGGDEFAFILQNTPTSGVQAVLESLRQAMRVRFAEERLPVTCSIGAVTFVDPPLDEQTALQIADSLMYQAKQSGRDRNFHKVIHPSAYYFRNKAEQLLLRVPEG